MRVTVKICGEPQVFLWFKGALLRMSDADELGHDLPCEKLQTSRTKTPEKLWSLLKLELDLPRN
jgi:hypothetical protein